MDVTIEYERECGVCHGRSAWLSDYKCENCNSTGRIPTEEGRGLLEFLEHQGFRPATNQTGGGE